MKFIINRASAIFNRPCKEAYQLEGKQEIYDLWYIDIDSLEDMLEFIRKYDDIVIRKTDDVGQPNVITIYDDYLE